MIDRDVFDYCLNELIRREFIQEDSPKHYIYIP